MSGEAAEGDPLSILRHFQSRYVRIVVSVGLIAFLLSRLNLTRTLHDMLSARWDWLSFSLATFALSLVLGTVQWVMLLARQGISLAFSKALSFYFVGAFFNNFLPANIGGDVVRIYDVYHESCRPDQAIAATVTDRLFGMVALALLAVPAGVFVAVRYEALGLERNFGLASLAIVLAFVAILVLASVVLFSRRLARLLRNLLRPLMIRGLHDRFKKIYEAFHLYSRTPRTLAAVLAVSLVVQALRTIVHYQVAQAMGLPIPVIYFFLFVPVIAIFIALPISIGGLGVREGLGIFFFCKAVPGLTSEQAFTMGLLAYVVGVIVSLVGGVIYLARGPRPARIEQELEGGTLENRVGRQS